MVFGGGSEKIQCKKEASWGGGFAGGTAQVFGDIFDFKGGLDSSTTQLFSLNGSGQPTRLVDGVLNVTGSMSWYLSDGRELEAIFGSLTDAGSGTFTLAVDDSLPSYSIIRKFDDTKNEEYDGLMLSSVTIELNAGEPVICNADWIAKKGYPVTTTVTPPTVTLDPYMFGDGCFAINSNQMQFDKLSFTLERSLTPRKGIDCGVSAGELRLINSLTPKQLVCSWNGTAVCNYKMLEELMGGSSIADRRTDVTSTLTLTATGRTFVLTLTGRVTAVSKSSDPQADYAVIEVSGLVKTTEGSGTYIV